MKLGLQMAQVMQQPLAALQLALSGGQQPPRR